MILHPPTAHFAIVLPVIASAFGLAYMISKSETMSKISARIAFITALAMIGVWYTGSQAGPQIYGFLDAAGKHELSEHKELGLYLAIFMPIVALMQMAGCKLRKFGLQAFGIVLTIVVMLATFVQGKHGGELVYEHGKPFQMTQLQKFMQSDDFDMADEEEKTTLIKEQISSIAEVTCEKLGCQAKETEDEE